MNKIFKFIFNIVFYIFIAIVIVFSIISFKAEDYKGVRKVGKYAFCNVLTGSMEPTISTGSLIVVKELDKEDINVNDIVTIVSEETKSVVTHRIVELNGENYVTKGDANNTIDSFKVNYDMIVGKVILVIPFIGGIIKLIQINIIPIIVGIVLLYILFEVLKRIKKQSGVKINE